MTNLILRPTRSNPFNDFDRIFDNFFGHIAHPVSRNFGACESNECSNDAEFAPRTDIVETNNSINLTLELPGMSRDDIKVSINNDLLTISGKRGSETETKESGYIRREINSGTFSRSFTLPDTVNKEKINADYKNGLLTVKLAKLEEVKPKEIEIDIS